MNWLMKPIKFFNDVYICNMFDIYQYLFLIRNVLKNYFNFVRFIKYSTVQLTLTYVITYMLLVVNTLFVSIYDENLLD